MFIMHVFYAFVYVLFQHVVHGKAHRQKVLILIYFCTGPSKRGMSAVSMVGTSGDMTPNSSSPISA